MHTDYISSPRPLVNLISNKEFDPSHLYALPSKSVLRPNHAKCHQPKGEASTNTGLSNSRPKIISLGEKFKNSAHSSSQESNNSHSNHSGASDVTLPLDEPIEYADAWMETHLWIVFINKVFFLNREKFFNNVQLSVLNLALLTIFDDVILYIYIAIFIRRMIRLPKFKDLKNISCLNWK